MGVSRPDDDFSKLITEHANNLCPFPDRVIALPDCDSIDLTTLPDCIVHKFNPRRPLSCLPYLLGLLNKYEALGIKVYLFRVETQIFAPSQMEGYDTFLIKNHSLIAALMWMRDSTHFRTPPNIACILDHWEIFFPDAAQFEIDFPDPGPTEYRDLFFSLQEKLQELHIPRSLPTPILADVEMLEYSRKDLWMPQPRVLLASELDLSESEKALGFALPPLLRDLHRCVCNGLGEDAHLWEFMGILGGVQHQAENGYDSVTMYTDAKTREELKDLNWPDLLFPFEDMGCITTRCIDCSKPDLPLLDFEAGQIEETGRSLLELLESWAEQY